jgi:hypothetical protein
MAKAETKIRVTTEEMPATPATGGERRSVTHVTSGVADLRHFMLKATVGVALKESVSRCGRHFVSGPEKVLVGR